MALYFLKNIFFHFLFLSNCLILILYGGAWGDLSMLCTSAHYFLAILSKGERYWVAARGDNLWVRLAEKQQSSKLQLSLAITIAAIPHASD